MPTSLQVGVVSLPESFFWGHTAGPWQTENVTVRAQCTLNAAKLGSLGCPICMFSGLYNSSKPAIKHLLLMRNLE